MTVGAFPAKGGPLRLRGGHGPDLSREAQEVLKVHLTKRRCAGLSGTSGRARPGLRHFAEITSDLAKRQGTNSSEGELPNLPLEDALQLVHLYAERGSPKYERAAMRWLERYLSEGEPRLRHFAEVTADLARRTE
jgi:hypothetical protein